MRRLFSASPDGLGWDDHNLLGVEAMAVDPVDVGPGHHDLAAGRRERSRTF